MELLFFFGFTGSMVYCNVDNRLQGNVRAMHTGGRQVVAVRLSQLVEAIEQCDDEYVLDGLNITKVDNVLTPLANVRNVFHQASPNAMVALIEYSENKNRSLDVHIFEQGPQTISYIPNAWLLAERTINNKLALGVRYAPPPAITNG